MWKNTNSTVTDLDLDFKLKRAMRSGDTLSFKRLVKGGVNVNSCYWYNSTLLHEAVQDGNLELVEFLLQNKANVNSKNDDERTPLHIACRAGLKDIVNVLLKYGANVNLQTMAQQTPLHVASWRGKDEIVKVLIDAGADVNIQDKDGWLPIHWALRLQKAGMVDYFIKHGSVLDRPTGKAKRSPFITAVVEKKYQVAQMLLKHGADCTLMEKASETVDSILKDSQIKTSVKLEIIQVLIKCGIKCSKSDLLLCFSNKFTSDHERETLSMNLKERDESLAGICRSSVRSYLRVCCRGRSIYNNVQQLPIPKVLKEYIAFDGDFKVF